MGSTKEKVYERKLTLPYLPWLVSTLFHGIAQKWVPQPFVALSQHCVATKPGHCQASVAAFSENMQLGLLVRFDQPLKQNFKNDCWCVS